jgi:hypothetical protein
MSEIIASSSGSEIRKNFCLLPQQSQQVRNNAFFFILVGFMLATLPFLGMQQILLTLTPPVLILCICHFVALRIFLRRP